MTAPLRRRIVAIGECMVEMAPVGEGRFRMGFAGDTLNTAWYLRRALPPDWQVDYLTAVGTDAVSQRMVAFFAAAGLGTAHVARLPDRTVGLYLIELRDGERSFSYWRGQSAARLLAQDASALGAGLAGAGLIYLSGITLAILDPADRGRLLDAIGDARRQGACVAFDPNLRPRLWPDAATMCRAVTEAAGLADILLPSHEDEAAQFGDADPQATARRYHDAGAALVVVKDGPRPVVTLGASGGASGKASDRLSGGASGLAQHSSVPAVRVVDTTAAGDSFNAAFLAANLQGAGLADAVKAGARLAARVIGSPGALVE